MLLPLRRSKTPWRVHKNVRFEAIRFPMVGNHVPEAAHADADSRFERGSAVSASRTRRARPPGTITYLSRYTDGSQLSFAYLQATRYLKSQLALFPRACGSNTRC